MKIRKIVAMLLATAVVFTSSGFTQVAYAADTTGEETVASEEVSVDADTQEDVATDAGDKENADAETSQESSDGEDEGTDAGNAQQEGAADNQENEGDTPIEELEKPAEGELTPEELAALEEAKLLEQEKLLEEDELLEEEEIEYDEDGMIIHAADDYFERPAAEGGPLKLLPGAVLAGTIRIPWNTTEIPANIFKSNSMVKKILIEEKYGGEAKTPKLTKIADEAFAYSKIEEIELPANVEIGEGAFRYSKLKKINFIKTDSSHSAAKSTLSVIKANTFQSTQLETADFPSCTKIGDSAFAGCKNLKIVKMPSLETIEAAAFYDCSYLGDGFAFREMTNLKKIGNDAFAYCGFSKVDLSSNTQLKSLVTRDGAEPTGDYDEENSGLGLSAFSYNKNLTYIMFATKEATNIDYIPGGICEGCTNLSSVVIPTAAVVIGDSAFEECTNLRTIDIQNVQYVKSKAFNNCYNLKDITMRYKGNGKMLLYKDAFPTNTGVTVRGYHRDVEAFANNMSGYKFESLNEKHNIRVYTTGGAKVVLSASSAVVDQTITATVTSSNPLKELYYSSSETGTVNLDFDTMEIKGSSSVITYTFKMPDNNIDFYAKALTAQELNAMSLSAEFETTTVVPGSTNPDSDNGVYTWEKRGGFAKIKIMGNEQLPNWLFKFSSDKPNVVSVDANGVISGVSEGKAIITATANWNKSKTCKFAITVEGDVKIRRLYNGKDAGLDILTKYIKDCSTPCELSIDPVTKYPVLTLNQTDLSKKAATVTLSFDAYGADDYSTAPDTTKSYNVTSTWSSSDTAIAKLKSATSNYNENVVTIAKGASGEAKISMYTLNKGETKVNQHSEEQKDNSEDNLTYVIIKVIDTTPRLGEKDITVNYQLLNGTPITVVPVYGMEINDDEGLTVVEKRTVNGQVEYYESDTTKQFKVSYDESDGLYYISATERVNLALGKKTAYKNKFYLQGRFKKGIEGMFYIPVPNITLTNESLKPKLTQTGSINIFYNALATAEEKGSVTVTQSLSDYEVEKYELVSAANYKKANSEVSDKEHGSVDHMTKGGQNVPFDSFRYNFDVAFAVDGGGHTVNNQAAITMSDDTASDAGYCKVSNKPVVAGYLAIHYKGYRDPVYVALTVKTVNTAPTYLLSQTSATVAKNSTAAHEFDLYLYPKGKANAPGNAVVLGNKVYDGTSGYKCYVNLDAKLTKTNVVENKLQDKAKLDADRLHLEVPEGSAPIAGKARIALHMKTWADKTKYLYYDFTLNTTDKVTAVFEKNVSTINVNKAFYNTSDEDDASAAKYSQMVKVVSSLPSDVEVAEITSAGDGRNTGNAANCAAYDAVKGLVELKADTGEIYVRQPNKSELDDIINGRYTLKIATKLKYKGTGAAFVANTLTFTINVTNAAPAVSLGTITLNTTANAVSEKREVSCKYTNLPKDLLQSDFALAVDGASFKHTSKAISDGSDGKFKNPKTKAEFEADVAQIVYPATSNLGGYATAKKGTDPSKYSASVGTYTVTGALLASSDKNLTAKTANYNIVLTENKITPTITLKQLSTDTMNLIIPDSGYNYSTTLNNITGKIRSEVGVMEYDSASRRYVESRFVASYDQTTGITRITVRDGWTGNGDAGNPNEKWNSAEIKPNTAYALTLFYGVDSMKHYSSPASPTAPNRYDGYDVEVPLNVTPKETFPKLTVTAAKPYAYAGQNRETGYGVVADKTRDNQWDIKVKVKLENSFWLKKDVNKNGKYESWLGDELTTATVSGVDWANTVAKVYQDEFRIVPVTFKYDKTTGVITFAVRLHNASEQMQNKTYNLVFAPTFDERQKKDPVKSTNSFTVKVEVKK